MLASVENRVVLKTAVSDSKRRLSRALDYSKPFGGEDSNAITSPFHLNDNDFA